MMHINFLGSDRKNEKGGMDLRLWLRLWLRLYCGINGVYLRREKERREKREMNGKESYGLLFQTNIFEKKSKGILFQRIT
jgi:hypothetical protein